MRWLLLVTLAACASPGSSRPAAPSPRPAAPIAACDTRTEAAQHAVYKRVTGLDFVGQEDFYGQTCLSAAATFPGLLTTGTFATEVGCLWSDEHSDDPSSPMAWVGAIYDCRFHPSVAEVAAPAMARAGWTAGDAARRIQLAWAWIGEVAHDEAMTAAPSDPWPAGPAFTAPVARTRPDGGVTAIFWISLPTMGRGVAFRQLSIGFSRDGVASEPVSVAETAAD